MVFEKYFKLLQKLGHAALIASLLGAFEVAPPLLFFAQEWEKRERKLEPNNI